MLRPENGNGCSIALKTAMLTPPCFFHQAGGKLQGVLPDTTATAGHIYQGPESPGPVAVKQAQ
eukprot:3435505-Pyramimonas_sp.AAC.1